MNYKLTQHYLKGAEQLIAAFNELNDAKLFATKKSSSDEVEGKRLVYKIYNDFELLHVSNESNLAISNDEDPETFSKAKFIFTVMIKPTGTIERRNIAYFNNQEDARLFVESKCSMDSSNSIDLFFIFKDTILIDTLNKNSINNRALRAEGSGGNEKGSKFRPTPTPSRPTPPGGPPDCWSDDNDDESPK